MGHIVSTHITYNIEPVIIGEVMRSTNVSDRSLTPRRRTRQYRNTGKPHFPKQIRHSPAQFRMIILYMERTILQPQKFDGMKLVMIAHNRTSKERIRGGSRDHYFFIISNEKITSFSCRR